MLTRKFFLSMPLFLVVFLLQEALVNQVHLPLSGFSLLLILALMWAAISPPEVGAMTGFGVGILMDLSQSSGGPIGQWTLVMILVGFSIAFLGYGDDNLRANPMSIIFLVSIGVVAAEVLYLVIGLLLGMEIGTTFDVLATIFGAGLWSAIISPLMVPIVSRIHAAIFEGSNRP